MGHWHNSFVGKRTRSGCLGNLSKDLYSTCVTCSAPHLSSGDKAALDKVREGAIEDLSSGKCPSRGSGHKSRRLGKIGRSTHGHCASRASAHPKRILQGHLSWIRAGISFTPREVWMSERSSGAGSRMRLTGFSKRRVNKAIGRTLTSFVKSRLYLAFTLRDTLHASRLGLIFIVRSRQPR